MSLSRMASLAGWVPVALVFGQHVAAPAGVKDGSMSPTLRGPGGCAGSREEDDDDEDASDRRRRRRSLYSSSSSTSTSTSTSTPPPPHQDDQPSLISVALSGGDVVLVDKLAARTQRYKRGDVVLLR